MELPNLHSVQISLLGSPPVFPGLLRCSVGPSYPIHTQIPSSAAPRCGKRYITLPATRPEPGELPGALHRNTRVGKMGVEHWDSSFLFPPITAEGQNHVISFLTRMPPTGLPAPASPLYSLPTMLLPVAVLQKGPDSALLLLKRSLKAARTVISGRKATSLSMPLKAPPELATPSSFHVFPGP